MLPVCGIFWVNFKTLVGFPTVFCEFVCDLHPGYTIEVLLFWPRPSSPYPLWFHSSPGPCHQLGLCGIFLTHPPVLQLPSYLKQGSYVDIVFQWWHCACAVVLTLRLRSLASLIACGLVTLVLLTINFDLISSSICPIASLLL